MAGYVFGGACINLQAVERYEYTKVREAWNLKIGASVLKRGCAVLNVAVPSSGNPLSLPSWIVHP
jgi:hypothetical protein